MEANSENCKEIFGYGKHKNKYLILCQATAHILNHIKISKLFVVHNIWYLNQEFMVRIYVNVRQLITSCSLEKEKGKASEKNNEEQNSLQP